MDSYSILFAIGAALVGPIVLIIALNRKRPGSSALAAALCLAFLFFTTFTIVNEGVMQVVQNHAQNFWGIQVWYDLMIAVGIALFFIVPRARAAGMNILPWAIFVALTASIGLLAMIARLFWLEQQAPE